MMFQTRHTKWALYKLFKVKYLNKLVVNQTDPDIFAFSTLSSSVVSNIGIVEVEMMMQKFKLCIIINNPETTAHCLYL